MLAGDGLIVLAFETIASARVSPTILPRLIRCVARGVGANGGLVAGQAWESEQSVAHPYIDIAHRAALLYSFALLLVATFVELSGWGTVVNLVAAAAMAFYFFAAIAGYMAHGLRRDTDNQFRDAVPGTHAFMLSLIVAEIGGWLVLIAGFLDGQVF